MGNLIVIESGTDGSGKATQSDILYKYLKSEGYKVRKLTYPNYGSRACSLVEMYLAGVFGENPDDVNPYTVSTFFAADRYASFKTDWEDFYEDKDAIVIADRYTTSNLICQSAKFNSLKEIDSYVYWIEELEYEKNNIPAPDLVIYLDLPVNFSLNMMVGRENKMTGRLKKDIHESNEGYLRKCYKTSKYLSEKFGWKRVNCIDDNNKVKSIEAIAEEIKEITTNFLSKNI
ncbi:thymidylate kinase [Clostridium sp.]|uniref:dTMP kinase n=1 Tax=Clostridium sp. TaxID=1506 RepID=UPI001B6A7669|nr:deoxynucleoside kinase [Clostridium sp.]